MALRLVHSVRELPTLAEPSTEDLAVLDRGPEGNAASSEDLDALVSEAGALEGRLPPDAAARVADRRARLERMREIHGAHHRRELGALRLRDVIREAERALDQGRRVLSSLLEGGEPLTPDEIASIEAAAVPDPYERLVRRAAAQLGAVVGYEGHALALEEWLRGEREVIVLADPSD